MGMLPSLDALELLRADRRAAAGIIWLKPWALAAVLYSHPATKPERCRTSKTAG
jgi:hypothetical protein